MLFLSRNFIRFIWPLFFCMVFIYLFLAVKVNANKKELKVSIVEIQFSDLVQSLSYIGMIERQGVTQVVSRQKGLVTQLEYRSSDKVMNIDKILTIEPIDPGYSKSDVFSPFKKAEILRTYVKNGDFVNADDLLLELVHDNNYIAFVDVPSYEIKRFKESMVVVLSLLGESTDNIDLPISDINFQAPKKGRSLYRVGMMIDCKKFDCQYEHLTGRFIMAKIDFNKSDNIYIPRSALVNGESLIMKLDEKLNIVYQSISVKQYLNEQFILVDDGVSVGDKVIVEYSYYPKEYEKVDIVNVLKI